MNKLKKVLTNTRIIILLIFLALSVVAIQPSLNNEGVTIRNVATNSSAALAEISNPESGSSPMSREVIESMNNVPITDVGSYKNFVATLNADDKIILKTNKQTYFLTVLPSYKVTTLNETKTINVTKLKFNPETNTSYNVTEFVEEPIVIKEINGTQNIGLSVYDRPTSNIRKGLDLEGGTRVILEPVGEIDENDIDIVIDNIKRRLNVYGVSDIIVRPTKDFAGNLFIAVEIAGVNKDEVRELLSKQGKFEAKVGSTTVFLGGDDVAYVCRTPDCSGIDPYSGCGQSGDQHFCRFRFAIKLSPEAAQRQADATNNLQVVLDTSGEGYLTENLSLYLDDQLVDQLRISSELKGSAQTDISITGSGIGLTEREAISDALASMKQLQTVLITGSLPVKLDIVKTDAVSPVLGQTFVKNVLYVGLLAMIAVVLVVFIRYREWRVSIPMVITMVSEVVILLGMASLIGWRLDLAAIAGIIIAVGTGVDDQIVIADETLRKEHRTVLSWKERLKRAFFIIMAAYFTTVVAMMPLWFAGAGLLKGFALTTILGVSIGVFITRPAFAVIMENLVNK